MLLSLRKLSHLRIPGTRMTPGPHHWRRGRHLVMQVSRTRRQLLLSKHRRSKQLQHSQIQLPILGISPQTTPGLRP